MTWLLALLFNCIYLIVSYYLIQLRLSQSREWEKEEGIGVTTRNKTLNILVENDIALLPATRREKKTASVEKEGRDTK